MTKRLSTAERNRIIYDYINGIMDENYEVKKTRTNKYQVRKRRSPFIPPEPLPQRVVQEAEPEQEEGEQEEEHALNRISNEQLLTKLTSLLDTKAQEDDEEEYIDTAQMETPYAPQETYQPAPPRRCGRKRLSLI